MTTTIEEIDIKDAKDGDLEVTLRGKAEEVVKVLVGGLPFEALEQVRDAMQEELAKRHSTGGHARNCAKWVHAGPDGTLFDAPLWAPYATCTCGHDEA